MLLLFPRGHFLGSNCYIIFQDNLQPTKPCSKALKKKHVQILAGEATKKRVNFWFSLLSYLCYLMRKYNPFYKSTNSGVTRGYMPENDHMTSWKIPMFMVDVPASHVSFRGGK